MSGGGTKRLRPVRLWPKAFASPERFRLWLERHAGTSEILVRCFKTHASHRGVTYHQALDEALCVGWIDGVRRALDEDSFSVRFTPRRARSAWSTVNVRRVAELRDEGRMSPAGLSAFEARVKARYSFESRPRQLAPAFLRRLRANEPAWRFFEAQPPWYRRTAAFWVMSAARPETRERRLAVLIESSERRQGVPPLPLPKPGRRREAPRATRPPRRALARAES